MGLILVFVIIFVLKITLKMQSLIIFLNVSFVFLCAATISYDRISRTTNKYGNNRLLNSIDAQPDLGLRSSEFRRFNSRSVKHRDSSLTRKPNLKAINSDIEKTWLKKKTFFVKAPPPCNVIKSKPKGQIWSTLTNNKDYFNYVGKIRIQPPSENCTNQLIDSDRRSRKIIVKPICIDCKPSTNNSSSFVDSYNDTNVIKSHSNESIDTNRSIIGKRRKISKNELFKIKNKRLKSVTRSQRINEENRLPNNYSTLNEFTSESTGFSNVRIEDKVPNINNETEEDRKNSFQNSPKLIERSVDDDYPPLILPVGLRAGATTNQLTTVYNISLALGILTLSCLLLLGIGIAVVCFWFNEYPSSCSSLKDSTSFAYKPLKVKKRQSRENSSTLKDYTEYPGENNPAVLECKQSAQYSQISQPTQSPQTANRENSERDKERLQLRDFFKNGAHLKDFFEEKEEEERVRASKGSFDLAFVDDFTSKNEDISTKRNGNESRNEFCKPLASSTPFKREKTREDDILNRRNIQKEEDLQSVFNSSTTTTTKDNHIFNLGEYYKLVVPDLETIDDVPTLNCGEFSLDSQDDSDQNEFAIENKAIPIDYVIKNINRDTSLVKDDSRSQKRDYFLTPNNENSDVYSSTGLFDVKEKSSTSSVSQVNVLSSTNLSLKSIPNSIQTSKIPKWSSFKYK